jgi:SAM-dependent methyltransferase
VATLPRVPPGDPHRDEWRLREDSAGRLIRYLARLRRPLAVLEIGCGNGWLANRVARLDRSRVVGLDANEPELDQARRVFRGRPNLAFVSGDATAASPPAERPDIILLASVVQYVADLPGLLRRLSAWHDPGGEIHIIDSPFYGSDEVAAARERTRAHYSNLGVPEMAEVYHAHEWRSLEGFAFEVLYGPDSVRARFERRVLGRPRSPFPWIRIRPVGQPPAFPDPAEPRANARSAPSTGRPRSPNSPSG